MARAPDRLGALNVSIFSSRGSVNDFCDTTFAAAGDPRLRPLFSGSRLCLCRCGGARVMAWPRCRSRDDVPLPFVARASCPCVAGPSWPCAVRRCRPSLGRALVRPVVAVSLPCIAPSPLSPAPAPRENLQEPLPEGRPPAIILRAHCIPESDHRKEVCDTLFGKRPALPHEVLPPVPHVDVYHCRIVL